MKLEQEFEVAAPLEQVWQALIDVEQVAPNLPGAAVTGRNEDGTYNGTFAVKIGPTSASYEGKLEMVALDEATHTATMRAEGTDRRGQGGAKATITSTVTEADDGATRVSVLTDYRITGRLARFGRGGMIEDISEKLLKQFAESLRQSLATDGGATQSDPEPAPVAAEVPPTAAADAAPPADAEPPPVEADAAPPADSVSPPAATDAAPPADSVSPPAAPDAAPPADAPAAPPPPPEPFDAGSVLADVAMDRVRASRVPLILTVVAFVVVVRRLRRRRRRG
jgi:carbon monoxide dehydrogenase subunit G